MIWQQVSYAGRDLLKVLCRGAHGVACMVMSVEISLHSIEEQASNYITWLPGILIPVRSWLFESTASFVFLHSFSCTHLRKIAQTTSWMSMSGCEVMMETAIIFPLAWIIHQYSAANSNLYSNKTIRSTSHLSEWKFTFAANFSPIVLLWVS